MQHVEVARHAAASEGERHVVRLRLAPRRSAAAAPMRRAHARAGGAVRAGPAPRLPSVVTT
ncbi:hypothetical protein C1N75_06560 [Curtobacterium sp. SGAir0571]